MTSSREDIWRAFTDAYDADGGHSSGIFAGLDAAIPLIEANVREQGDRDPYAAQTAAYAQLLEQHAAAVNSTPPQPDLRPEDVRARLLHLAIDYGKSVDGLSVESTLVLAERFRAYLETGATTDAD